MMNLPLSVTLTRITDFVIKGSVISLISLVLYSNCYADFATYVTAGIGIGESRTQGNYTQALHNTVFTMGFDYDEKRVLFLARGTSSTDNNFKSSDLILGYGNQYIKLGTGYIGLQTSIPSNPNSLFDTSGQNATDTRKRIDISVTTMPIFLRLKPIALENFNLLIDAYYGLSSKGSATFPFLPDLNGGYGTVSTVSKKQGGAKGLTISATWRLPYKWSAIRLAYRYREATMKKQTSYIKDDILHVLGAVTTPELTFQSRVIMLSFVVAR